MILTKMVPDRENTVLEKANISIRPCKNAITSYVVSGLGHAKTTKNFARKVLTCDS